MIHVATYNLYLGADLSLLFGVPVEEMESAVTTLLGQLEITDFPTRAGAIAKLLVDTDVDLVGLQEVTVWTRDGEVVCDFLRELTGALADLGAEYDVRAANANFSGEGAGLAVSGRNVTLVKRGCAVEDERTGDFAAALTVPTPMGQVRIARSWGWVDATVQGQALRFVNTHTEAYDGDVRNKQRDELLAAIGDPGRPVVLVGDFNSTPEFVGVPASYDDAWLAAGGAPDGGATCGQAPELRNEESALTQRIDYVWVRDLEVSRCWLLGADPGDRTESGLWPSDHAGVVAALVRRAGSASRRVAARSG